MGEDRSAIHADHPSIAWAESHRLAKGWSMARTPLQVLAKIQADFTEAWRAYVGLLHAWWQYKDLVRELSALSDAELADIGLMRCHIDRLARGMIWDEPTANVSPTKAAELKSARETSSPPENRIDDGQTAVGVGAIWP